MLSVLFHCKPDNVGDPADYLASNQFKGFSLPMDLGSKGQGFARRRQENVVSRQWLPRTPEDFLLDQVLANLLGRLYLEVPIGGPGGPGAWPRGCTTRRLDGVRLSTNFGELASITSYTGTGCGTIFAAELQNRDAELIEVKVSLNRPSAKPSQAAACLSANTTVRRGGRLFCVNTQTLRSLGSASRRISTLRYSFRRELRN